MQLKTRAPGLVIDRYTQERWFLRRDDDGIKRYHKRPDDKGRMPSAFFSTLGALKTEFRAG